MKGEHLQLRRDFVQENHSTPENLLRTNLLRNLDTLDIKFDTLFQDGRLKKCWGADFFEAFRSWGLYFDSQSHTIHGTGIFTYIYHKNQPFM